MSSVKIIHDKPLLSLFIQHPLVIDVTQLLKINSGVMNMHLFRQTVADHWGLRFGNVLKINCSGFQ
jgi:hypothetical protein